MGTRSLWQTTNQTAGHGNQHTGNGSARCVREFRIGSDVFSRLRRGQAVIYTPLAGDPSIADIALLTLDHGQPGWIDQSAERHACEMAVHPEEALPDLAPAEAASTGSEPPGSDQQIDPDVL